MGAAWGWNKAPILNWPREGPEETNSRRAPRGDGGILEPMRIVMSQESPAREELESFFDLVYSERDRLAVLLPDIDPGDLLAIVKNVLLPFGKGKRFFLREIRPGVYVP